MGRNETIREEADEWRRQGRINDEFHAWIQQEYPLGRDQGTERRLQQILLAFAGMLAIIGIFTLVAEYWRNFDDVQKLWILRLFVLMAIGLGTALHFPRKTRVLTHVLLPLALPLYLFSMAYADPAYDRQTGQMPGMDALDLQEISTLVVGVAGMAAAVLVGLQRFPTLAMGGPPGLIGVLFFLTTYVEMSVAEERVLQWSCLAIVIVLHALLLMAWLGVVHIPYVWDPLALRFALLGNVPMGFVLITALVNSYEYSRYEPGEGTIQYYDGTLVGVITTAAYASVLLGFGLRLGLPELVGISGLFLIVDAVWLGSAKGGVIGAVLAILATAVLLGVLAQRGLLRRIFKPRLPPTNARPTPTLGRPVGPR